MIRSYLSLIKFSHTIFALPFALIGALLGFVHFGDHDHLPQHMLSSLTVWQNQGINYFLKTFFLVIGCMVFARSAAMAFNRYLDRSIDARNPRTAIREIPSGVISSGGALVFTVCMSLLFVLCAFFINTICFLLSPIALLVILGYSYTKRFTFLCHFILGLGLSLAPIGAYLAVMGEFQPLPVFFSVIVFFWVSGFDIIYALQDEAFDKANGLYSIPVRMGKRKALLLSRILHLLVITLLLYSIFAYDFGIWYIVGSSVFGSLLIYQHTLVKPDDLSRVNLAFFTSNGIASVVFFIFVTIELLL